MQRVAIATIIAVVGAALAWMRLGTHHYRHDQAGRVDDQDSLASQARLEVRYSTCGVIDRPSDRRFRLCSYLSAGGTLGSVDPLGGKSDAVPPRHEQSQHADSAHGTQPSPAQGSWITRWQTIVVTLITAAATIVAALIGVTYHGDENKSPATQNQGIQPALAAITSTLFAAAPSGGRIIAIRGTVRPPEARDGNIYALARPVNGQPPLHGQNWYVSNAAVIKPDGSWDTYINVDPSEKRDLAIQAAFFDSIPCPAGVDCDATDGVPSPSPSPVPGTIPVPVPPNTSEIRSVLENSGPAGARRVSSTQVLHGGS
jgi:hypothetical protein